MFKIKFLLIIPLLFLSQESFSKDVCSEIRQKPARCSDRPLRSDQVNNSLILTQIVANQLLEIETKERQAGRDFKIALISRQGTNLQKFFVMNDFPNGNYRSVDRLVSESQKEGSFPGQTSADYNYLSSQRDRTRSMRYSHVGIAVKNDRNSDAKVGAWTIYQLLWTCEMNHSSLFEDGLGTFFLDQMSDYGAQIIIPSAEIQDRVEALLLNSHHRKSLVKNWHNQSYNAVAHWDSQTEQNSNQWVLEVLAAAQRPIGSVVTRKQTHEVLSAHGYRPTQVMLSGLYSLITLPGVTQLLPGTVCLQNQKYGTSLGIGEVISVLSIEEYLKRNNLIQDIIETKVPDELRFEPIREEKAVQINQ